MNLLHKRSAFSRSPIGRMIHAILRLHFEYKIILVGNLFLALGMVLPWARVLVRDTTYVSFLPFEYIAAPISYVTLLCGLVSIYHTVLEISGVQKWKILKHENAIQLGCSLESFLLTTLAFFIYSGKSIQSSLTPEIGLYTAVLGALLMSIGSIFLCIKASKSSNQSVIVHEKPQEEELPLYYTDDDISASPMATYQADERMYQSPYQEQDSQEVPVESEDVSTPIGSSNTTEQHPPHLS